jgi:magnesium transporter
MSARRREKQREKAFHRRRPPVGAAPGALIFPPGATRIHVIRYDKERQLERSDVPVEDLASLVQPGQVTWVEVEGLGDERVMRRLAGIFRIHPLALADVVNVGQRPKSEAYADFEFIVCRMACVRGAGEFDLEQVSLVLGRDFVVSFHESARDVFEPVRERLRRGALIRSMHADYLAYALLDTLIDGYYPVVETLGEELELLEAEVSERPRRGCLQRIHLTRRELLTFARVVHQQRDAVASMMRADHPLVGEAVRVYLRDSYDHAAQISDVLDSLRELALGLTDVYHSSVSMRTNEVIKVLTILSSIFIPLTFIVGVYGMNFEYMPEIRWRYGYAFAWLLMVGVVLGLVVYFRRKGWIGEETDDAPSAPADRTRREPSTGPRG